MFAERAISYGELVKIAREKRDRQLNKKFESRRSKARKQSKDKENREAYGSTMSIISKQIKSNLENLSPIGDASETYRYHRPSVRINEFSLPSASNYSAQKSNYGQSLTLNSDVYYQELQLMKQYSDYVREENKEFFIEIQRLSKEIQEVQSKALSKNEEKEININSICLNQVQLKDRIQVLEKQNEELKISNKKLQQILAEITQKQFKDTSIQFQAQIKDFNFQTQAPQVSHISVQTNMLCSSISSLQSHEEQLNSISQFLISFSPSPLPRGFSLPEMLCQALNNRITSSIEPYQAEISLLKRIQADRKEQEKIKSEIFKKLLTEASQRIEKLSAELKEMKIKDTQEHRLLLMKERAQNGLTALYRAFGSQ